ncbi:MAG: hypothetical protein HY690_07475 [Chloroflexi bacterium]|nr:hypothetical protein [Chloroflexota bacterium]
MIWGGKPSAYEERRIRTFVEHQYGLSETAISLSPKVGVKPRHCRQVLDSLVREGLVRRREFGDTEPIYYRYPGR